MIAIAFFDASNGTKRRKIVRITEQLPVAIAIVDNE
jgi:PII-like signaling protein